MVAALMADMNEIMVQMLRSLRDVDGVVGGFVWTKAGNLIVRDMPEYLDSGLLSEVGPRIERLYEAFRSAGDDLDAGTLVFGEHKLHVRELEAAFVAVLSSAEVNMSALTMALSIVGRGLSAELARPALASVQTRLAAAGSSGRASGGVVRSYRIHRVPD